MKKIKLKDIAEMAKVSETAVSLVLNHKPTRISEEKQQEIRNIAKKYNYRPSHVARALSMQKTKTIGMIIPDIENPFFSSFSKRLSKLLEAEGYMLIISNSDDKMTSDVMLLEQHINREVDALILCVSNESSSDSNFYSRHIQSLALPYVLVDRNFEGVSKNQIYFDNEVGGYLATKHLLDLGCKRIACITGGMNSNVGKMRYLGYKRAMAEYRFVLDEDIVFEGNFRYSSAVEPSKTIVSDESVDGVFASNDLMAYAIVNELIKYRQKKDRDLKIVGYDNLEYASMFGVPFASIEQDAAQLAVSACEMILKKIRENHDEDNIVLIPKLIIK